MAAGMSNYLELELLDHVFKLQTAQYTAPTHIYMGLLTTAPTDAVDGTEVTGGNYARVICDSWARSVNREVGNSAVITFNKPTASWGTVTHWELFDALTGGNRLWYGQFDDDIIIRSGDTYAAQIGTVIAKFSAGGISNYLANKLLEHVFKIQTWAGPSASWAALYNTSPGDDDSGTEVSGTSYARTQVLAAGWNTAAAGVTTNNGAIAFAAAGGAWTAANYGAVRDASITGNLLIYGALGTPATLAAADTFTILTTTLAVTFD